MNRLVIASEFSPITGGRTPEEGDFSGELFRDEVLAPKYRECLNKGGCLEIVFDNCYGIGTSFLEEAFGGLVRKYGYVDVLKHIKLIANDDETILVNVPKYIKAAEHTLKNKKSSLKRQIV